MVFTRFINEQDKMPQNNLADSDKQGKSSRCKGLGDWTKALVPVSIVKYKGVGLSSCLYQAGQPDFHLNSSKLCSTLPSRPICDQT